MILYFGDGRQIRGDLIKKAVLRQDLSPVPVTLELEVKADDDMERRLDEGQTVATASGDVLRIIKSVTATGKAVQGDRVDEGINVTAMLDACHKAAFVRGQAIVKENAALSAIYRSAGASLKTVAADFPVPRFYCPVGGTPTFHIARVLQEEGGAVRWRAGRLEFVRLQDLFQQKPVLQLPDTDNDNIDSGFLERHEVPWFYSVDETGAIVFGNRTKQRAATFVPRMNVQRLRNLTRCLVKRKNVRINYNDAVGAGDLIDFVDGDKLCVVTAAHVYENDDGADNTYTRLWCASLEG